MWAAVYITSFCFSVKQHIFMLADRTAIVRFPSERLAVVYLSNDDNDATFQRYPKMIDLFMNGNLREEHPKTDKIPVAEAVVKKMEEGDKYRETITLSPYTGVYFSEELSCVWVLKVLNYRLAIQHPRMQNITLRYSGNDSFGFLKFDRDTANNITGLKILGEGIAFVKSNQ